MNDYDIKLGIIEPNSISLSVNSYYRIPQPSHGGGPEFESQRAHSLYFLSFLI